MPAYTPKSNPRHSLKPCGADGTAEKKTMQQDMKMQEPHMTANDSPHVLLVDDEPAFGDVLARRLRRRNIRVTHALDGDTALRMLLNNEFSAVLLDLKMSGISGLEILNVLSRMVPDVPVIMISGHADQETVAHCLANGACQYLPKPCDADEIVSIITRMQKN